MPPSRQPLFGNLTPRETLQRLPMSKLSAWDRSLVLRALGSFVNRVKLLETIEFTLFGARRRRTIGFSPFDNTLPPPFVWEARNAVVTQLIS